LFVHHAHVAGAQPAVGGERVRRLIGIVPRSIADIVSGREPDVDFAFAA
jgi:hypothetical protein